LEPKGGVVANRWHASKNVTDLGFAARGKSSLLVSDFRLHESKNIIEEETQYN
jgi:hypothetical protein